MEKKGIYSIFQVAKWFLEKNSMTQKRLQKLCYYADAWYFTLKGKKLTGELYEAWVHGPVSTQLWDKYRHYYVSGNYMADLEANSLSEHEPITDPDDIEILELVWNTYGDMTGNALEALTHSELPWRKARIGYDTRQACSVAISYEDMKEYYSSIYEGVYDGV